jgi:hypothetical protein
MEADTSIWQKPGHFYFALTWKRTLWESPTNPLAINAYSTHDFTTGLPTDGLSATLPLPDYGRVARHPPRIRLHAPSSVSSYHQRTLAQLDMRHVSLRSSIG